LRRGRRDEARRALERAAPPRLAVYVPVRTQREVAFEYSRWV